MTETAQNAPLAVEYGGSIAYGTSQPMNRVASGGGTWFHRAVLTGLAPGGEYFYRITNAGGDPLTPGRSLSHRSGRRGRFQVFRLGRQPGAQPWRLDRQPARTDHLDDEAHGAVRRGLWSRQW